MTSLNPSRFNQLLQLVRQPQGIAALLSVGFHVVLFAAGPSFSGLSLASPGEAEAREEERQVPLIDLTPEEQSRLPDFSSPAYSFFPEQDNDLYSVFPPSGDSLPFNPGAEFGSLPSFPAPQPPSSSLPTTISPFGRSSIVLPSRRSPRPPSSNSRSSGRSSTPAPDSDSATPATPPAVDDTSAANANGSADDLIPDAAGEPHNETTPTDSTNAPDTEAQRANELLARVEYDDAQTRPDDVEIAKAAWLETVQEELGDNLAQAPEPITLKVPYNGRLCLSPEPTDGLLGLIGLPDDETDGLKLWTAVLKSTGYPFLNQAAGQALQELAQPVEPQADNESGTLEPNTLYQVVLEVEYDSQSCITREALLQSRTADHDDPNEAPAE
ncbi:hypothetical protein IQ254_05875 [Nodosilinea sp. LEGE 07088]|uniref:hypothetical protein n=1 Tax=Nodosilinea sp. LEGE 07088 TaxID=2777968 RepID=UPI00187F5FF9|nr:hypothetical protein [Nodosilinea sp. LEGE 07088]MBE9136735.1 hypothetical protein [Nodosilinea sp. LEGE 07088]